MSQVKSGVRKGRKHSMCKSTEEASRFEQLKEIQGRKEFREQKAAKMRLESETRILSILDINVL